MTLEIIRAERGVSVREVARQLGESYSTVDRWFNGQGMPRFDQAMKLAEYFEVSLDELAGKRAGATDPREEAVLRMVRLLGCDEAERRLLLAKEDAPAAASAPGKARVTIQEVTPDGPPSEPFPVDETGVIIPRPKPPRKHRRA